MSETSEEERRWDAEKRDFVADSRDEIAQDRQDGADLRESTADDRERLADEREASLDELERRLHEKAHDLEVSADQADQADQGDEERERSAAQRTREAESRKEAGVLRREGAAGRGSDLVDRSSASRRREADTPVTGLAIAFSEIARNLYAADNFDDVLDRIVGAAVATIVGGDLASITVREKGDVFRTVASTDADATKVDEAQYGADEGPCLDAVDQSVVHAREFPDERWPKLGSSLNDAGVNSSVSYQLASMSAAPGDQFSGSLNVYGTAPDAFDAEARQIGLVLATHASIAASAVGERESLEMFAGQLHEALSSRDVIGQAKGILMERLHLTPEEAFDALRRSSQRLNIKLREVAEQLTRTGEFEPSNEVDSGRGPR